MRNLQSILLVIGSSALGLVSCVAFVVCAFIALTKPGSGEEFGSAIYLAFFAIVGGLLGAIAGFLGSLSWVCERGREQWTRATWIGIVLGVLIAISVRFSGALNFLLLGDLTKWWSGLSLFLTAAACLGGFVGCLAGTAIEANSRCVSK
ncbi:MAG: hypothetical protein NTW75_03445 [Planctomycetales bacterium]|jgi:hypothetical protein|nr:hypothetical protein [Planctomycetales bacterium]